MRSPARLLLHNTAASSGETSSPSLPLQPSASAEQRMAAPPPVMAVDSDMVVILASLLCALVCVLGLALLSRCSCRRRRSASSSSSSDHPPKGLKKKAIDALPTISFAASPEPSPPAPWSSSSECAICLAEFAEGEGLRLLPRCGHGFHIACVDAWLRSCATCPSCRSAIVAVEPTKPAPAAPMVVIVVAGEGARCGRCGEVAAPSAGDGDATLTFLP